MYKKAISGSGIMFIIAVFVALIIAFAFFSFVLTSVKETQTENSDFYNTTNSTIRNVSTILPTFFIVLALISVFLFVVWGISLIRSK